MTPWIETASWRRFYTLLTGLSAESRFANALPAKSDGVDSDCITDPEAGERIMMRF